MLNHSSVGNSFLGTCTDEPEAQQNHECEYIWLAVLRGRSSETESDRSLLDPVRDYRFELPRIPIWVHLYDAEIVDVGLGGDPL